MWDDGCILPTPGVFELKNTMIQNSIPHDAVQTEGEPPLDMVIRGGVAGDQATVAWSTLPAACSKLHLGCC
jgi:hypothetical protein